MNTIGPDNRPSSSPGPTDRTASRSALQRAVLEPRTERQPGPTAVGPNPEDLVHLHPAGLEVQRRGRHVQAPDARPAGADLGDGLVPTFLEVAHPRPERERVVLAQALEVTDLEPGALHRRDDAADLVQLAVGEDVAIDEAVALEACAAGVRRPRDAVVQQTTAGSQQPPEPVEVHPKLREPYVLEHPDRADRVERPVGDVAVVLVPDLDAVDQAGLRDRLLSPVGLAPRGRHADGRHP